MRLILKGNVAERFWPRVDKNGPVIRAELGPCWRWTGGFGAQGYGKIRTPTGSRTTHRVSWELHNGAAPTGIHVLHRCDNRACVNPAHLFLGTNADNIADRVAKGRSHRALAKLTPNDVIDIRTLAGLVSRRELAKAFGVCKEAIRDIVLGKRWAAVA